MRTSASSEYRASAARKKKSLSREKILKRTIPYESVSMEWLQDPEYAAVYFKTMIEEFNKDADILAFLTGLRNLAKARGGIQALAKKIGMNREHLYRALSARGNPSFRTVMEITKALGLVIEIKQRKKSPLL